MSFKEYVDAGLSIRNELSLEVSCTLEGIEELRAHLDQLETLIQDKQYEAASAAGYNEVSGGFVYVQRCLGGIEELHLDEQLLLKELARVRGCTESEAQNFLESEISTRESS